MKCFIPCAALLLALTPVASFAASDAVASYTDHNLVVEKGGSSRFVAIEPIYAELSETCSAKGGSIESIQYEFTDLWGGSHPLTRVKATAVCRVTDNY
nr:hypothetical protein [Luteibacter rhizovicinus]